MKLYKTTVEVWTESDPMKFTALQLANMVFKGDAHAEKRDTYEMSLADDAVEAVRTFERRKRV